jgi:hypothetical protein
VAGEARRLRLTKHWTRRQLKERVAKLAIARADKLDDFRAIVEGLACDPLMLRGVIDDLVAEGRIRLVKPAPTKGKARRKPLPAGLFDRPPQWPSPGRVPSPAQMRDYHDKVERYRQRQRQTAQTPQDRFVARVKELRAAGEKKAVETACDELSVSHSTGYRWLKNSLSR